MLALEHHSGNNATKKGAMPILVQVHAREYCHAHFLPDTQSEHLEITPQSEGVLGTHKHMHTCIYTRAHKQSLLKKPQ